VLYGDSSTITCIATDPDYDPIEYIWSASEGAITGSGKEVTWVAPNKDGNFNITTTVKDKMGDQTTGSVMVTVSAPIKTITIDPIAAETGTVNQKNATDYSRTRAGDNAQDIGYRAFWSFDISKLAGKNIQNASLKFTTGSIMGKPFSYQLPYGLGGLLLWKTPYGAELPEFDCVGSMLSNTGRFLEPPDVVDVTTDIKLLTSYSVSRFQVEALFDRISNGSSTAEWIEWSSVVLEVTYSDR
ncbi:MAG: hypothetical protein JXB43_01715, partial [Dehalococcoidia bacterium]|nr:hypothetical protein [Dehalococcoidia bacterium]